MFFRKTKTIEQINIENKQQNLLIQNELINKKQELENKILEIKNKQIELVNLERKIENAEENYEKGNKCISEILEEISNKKQELSEKTIELNNLNKNLQATTQSFEDISNKERNKYIQEEEKYKSEYLKTLEEYTTVFQKTVDEKQTILKELNSQIINEQNKVNAAVEASKRAEEIKNKQDFYRLNLTNQDLQEIKKIREIIPYLHSAEPINKVIWKVYYENPCADLIGRVVGSGVHCGIYKITNIENNMCYVGQSVNIADRWRQHIKRGIGAEAPTRNKLYPAMLSIGAENFTFEIIEECPKNLLDEREDYWQEFFKAKEFGYSIK